MSDSVIVALVVGPLSAGLSAAGMWLLNHRKSNDEHEASVAQQWKEWSEQQGKRIDSLELRVNTLENELTEERRKTRRYADIVAALMRWSLALRDEVLSLGGRVPPAPPEVEEALTSLEI